jgi:hypothetical protein
VDTLHGYSNYDNVIFGNNWMGWAGLYSQGYEIPKLFDQFAAREKEIVNQKGY